MAKNPIAALIVAKAKKPAAEDPMATEGAPMEPDGDDEGKHAACEDMIAAIDQKDPAAFASALSAFIDMHN